MLFEKRNKKLLAQKKLKSYFITNNLKRLSAQNELRDYEVMMDQAGSDLWKLHAKMEEIRHDGQKNYDSYDYGNGYYYQSMKSIGVSGYRNTEERIEKLKLATRLKEKTVLDIGSNTGFLLLSLHKDIKSGLGVEFNPYLVQTAEAVKDYIGAENISLAASSFEDHVKKQEQFGAVLSLANHSTFDGNTKQSIDNYFKNIAFILEANGTLIFESHPPQIEPEDKLEGTLATIGKYFNIDERPQVDMEGFLDKNRTYVIATKK